MNAKSVIDNLQYKILGNPKTILRSRKVVGVFSQNRAFRTTLQNPIERFISHNKNNHLLLSSQSNLVTKKRSREDDMSLH